MEHHPKDRESPSRVVLVSRGLAHEPLARTILSSVHPVCCWSLFSLSVLQQMECMRRAKTKNEADAGIVMGKKSEHLAEISSRVSGNAARRLL